MSLPQLEGAASPSCPRCGAVPRVGDGRSPRAPPLEAGSPRWQRLRVEPTCPARLAVAPRDCPLGHVPLFGQQAEGEGPAFLCSEATVAARPHVAAYHSPAVRDFIHPGRGRRAAC